MAVGEKIIVVAAKAQIVEEDPHFRRFGIRGLAGDNHNPALTGEDQAIQYSVDENEMAEMIDDEVLLDAVDQFKVVATTKIAGIAYKNINGCIQGANRFSTGHNRFKIAKVKLHGRRSTDDLVTSSLSSFQRPTRPHNIRASQCEYTHCFKTNSRCAARYDDEFAIQVNSGSNFFRG